MHVTERESLYVTRTVRQPLGVVEDNANRLRTGNDPVRGMLLPTGGRIEIELPLREDRLHPACQHDLVPLRTTGALFSRSNRKVCDVEVELSPWTDTVTEVAIRPAPRRRDAATGRRRERWFGYAHAAADTLRAAFMLPATAVIDLTDPEREREQEPAAVAV